MRYLSLFSGIEGASVAWHPLGWECAGVSEIEPFPCAVIAHHYPTIPNLGDVTKITEEDIAALGRIDLVVFGSPCQDLSVAGLRKGFICESTDTLTRSGLFFVAMRIVAWARKHNGCRFALWENVPGSFSSSQGRDFAAVVGAMAGLEDVPVPPRGWGNEGVAVGSEGLVEWATLDAQWFGVAQRRRRVFALADFGNWSNRPPILLEPESLRRDTAPSREAWQEVAGTFAARSGISRNNHEHAVATTLQARMGEGGFDLETETPVVTHTLRGEGFDCDGGLIQTFDRQSTGEYGTAPVASTVAARDYKSASDLVAQPINFDAQMSVPQVDIDLCQTLGAKNPQAVAQPFQQTSDCLTAAYGTKWNGNASADNGSLFASHGIAVRRLTPVECERLQGFPDNYTQIPWRKKPASECPDGPRYKALGNSWAIPCVAWIGKRIQERINGTR